MIDTIEYYQCPRCRKVYAVPVSNVITRCTVLHPPWQCCHYAQEHIELTPAEIYWGPLLSLWDVV